MSQISVNNQETIDLVIARILNYNNAGEGGKTLPPRQRGSFRVPSISGLVLRNKVILTGGTIYLLSWITSQDDPSQPVDHYNVYALDSEGHTIGSSTSQHSPASIFLSIDGLTPVTFTVQTVLKNGSTSSLAAAPSVSG